MNKKLALLALSLLSLNGAAQAALQGRDLNGSTDSFEAYYDTDLNITWLANANNTPMAWVTAVAWAKNLSIVDAVNNINYANWRLPITNPINGVSYNISPSNNGSTDRGDNISEQGTPFAGSTASEMAHLFYNTLDNKSDCPVYTNCILSTQVGWGLTNTGPFTNLQPSGYWSGSGIPYTSDSSVNFAWDFDFYNGYQDLDVKDYGFYALAVSDGDVAAAIPEPETYAMMLAGLGLLSFVAHRRK